MEFNEIEARLLISRKLQEDEDWDIYEYIFNDIYNLQKVYPLKVYYKGFTDATLGDHPTFEYLEAVFWALQNDPCNFYSEEETIFSLMNNLDFFIANNAKEWFGLIVNYMLYHYKKHPFNVIINHLSKSSPESRNLVYRVLVSNTKNSFSFDDKGRIEKEYQDIIDYCLKE